MPEKTIKLSGSTVAAAFVVFVLVAAGLAVGAFFLGRRGSGYLNVNIEITLSSQPGFGADNASRTGSINSAIKSQLSYYGIDGYVSVVAISDVKYRATLKIPRKFEITDRLIADLVKNNESLRGIGGNGSSVLSVSLV